MHRDSEVNQASIQYSINPRSIALQSPRGILLLCRSVRTTFSGVVTSVQGSSKIIDSRDQRLVSRYYNDFRREDLFELAKNRG